MLRGQKHVLSQSTTPLACTLSLRKDKNNLGVGSRSFLTIDCFSSCTLVLLLKGVRHISCCTAANSDNPDYFHFGLEKTAPVLHFPAFRPLPKAPVLRFLSGQRFIEFHGLHICTFTRVKIAESARATIRGWRCRGSLFSHTSVPGLQTSMARRAHLLRRSADCICQR